MNVADRKPTGALRWALRLPIWLYRAHLGVLLGHRLVYIAHRGRRSGARREVVAEVVRYERALPELTVIAACGGTPDWFRNLQAAPAIEVRIGRQRWVGPRQRFLETDEIAAVLHAYQRLHPRAFAQIGPRLGFPADPDDPRWADAVRRIHAVALRPAGQPDGRPHL